MSKAKIFYFTLRDEQRKEEKLEWFKNTRFQDIPFQRITPDENGNWINLADTDFKTLLPLANKQTKLAKTKAQENAVFKLFSLGVSTNRDEWVYDYDKKTLEAKIKYFAKVFNQESKRFRGKDVTKIGEELSDAIKWSRDLKKEVVSGKEFHFEKDLLVESLYRPFFKQAFYAEPIINDILTDNHVQMFGEKFDKENKMIGVMGDATEKPFSTLASSIISDMNFLSPAAAGTKFFPLYRYTESGERVENITDWALEQFRARYEPSPLSSGSMPSPQPSPDGRGSVGSESPLPVGEDLGEGRVGKGKKPKLPEALLRAARELRRKATDAEKYLWSLLRNRQLAGYKFRRQHPLGRFVLDFYCHEAKLCVELDGGQHAEPAQADYDRERTVWLNREGIRVIRFWNTDVLNNIEGVLQSILIALTTPVEEEVKRRITKEDIFHYVYAVLHNPAYRKKYELDLKREFPRVPFYDDFWQWAAWGKRLMDLHLNYESAKPFGLKRMDLPDEKVPKELKVRLKANKEKGIIEIDEQTTLSGVPKEAWEYKLGNRSALEWILDQYKETKPKDKTIAEKFHTYRFADYKEEVIDLLKRVCTVSVETVKIMREMERDKES